MTVVSSNMRKTVVLLSMMFMTSSTYIGIAGAQDETYQIVLNTNGNNILYGSDNTFTVWNRATGIGYLRFFFGLGFPGDVVRTDTQLTMGGFGSASRIYSCQADGSMVTTPVPSEGTPQESLIRVRYNATDGYYRLQITEETPAVFVQFVLLSQGALRCTRGTEGSPLLFQTTSTSTTDKTVLVDHEHNAMQIPHISSQVSSS